MNYFAYWGEGFLNSNLFLGLVTIFVGGFAWWIYSMQKRDQRRNAAAVILQEIRRAEDILADYKLTKQFNFTKKMIANNSWTNNIQLFVDVLTIDEMDKISSLYSLGTKIDDAVTKHFDIMYSIDAIKVTERDAELRVPVTQPGQQPQNVPLIASPQTLITDNPQAVAALEKINAFFGLVTQEHELIYHSTICKKLKEIAGVK